MHSLPPREFLKIAMPGTINMAGTRKDTVASRRDGSVIPGHPGPLCQPLP